MGWGGQPDMSVQGERDADGNLTIEGYEQKKKQGGQPVGTAGEEWWKEQTRLYEKRVAERRNRAEVNTPEPNDETTSIAPPDTFAPFIREMQRRMTDRSLLGTSGRDRMFAGRAFSPQLSIRERVPLPPPNPIRDYMVSRGIKNTQSPALGQQGSSLQKKPINSGGKKTLGGFLGGGLG